MKKWIIWMMMCLATVLGAQDPTQLIGQAELSRVESGLIPYAEAMKLLSRRYSAHSPHHTTVCTLAAWRLAGQKGVVREWREFRDRLPPDNLWRSLFTLADIPASDHDALLKEARHLDSILANNELRFPDAVGDSALFDYMKGIGRSEIDAGLQVILARDHAQLYLLHELDSTLSWEIQYYQLADREADAVLLEKLQKRLRAAYLKSSKHIVPKLFALRLEGRDQASRALRGQLRDVPYLTDGRSLIELLNRVDQTEAFEKLIQPMIASELAVLNAKPDLTRRDAHKVKLTVQADQERDGVFSGNVKASLGNIEIQCERLELEQGLLKAQTAVRIEGIRNTGLIEAESADVTIRDLSFSLLNPTVQRGDKTLYFRSCHLLSSGILVESHSLFEGFNEVDWREDPALLDEIQARVPDEDLPRGIAYELALHLLQPHLTWHLPVTRQTEANLKDNRGRQQEALGWYDSDEKWDGAHTGEVWMWKSVEGQLEKEWEEKTGQVTSQPDVFWRLKDPDHPDVNRAKKLLQGGGDKAYAWYQALRRNNTVITFDVPPAIQTGEMVSVDVSNADEITFSLYRVKGAAQVAAVCGKIGDDFVFNEMLAPQQELWETLERAVMDTERQVQARGWELEDLAEEIALGKPVSEWRVSVAETKQVPFDISHVFDEYDWDSEIYWDMEAEFFQDDCQHLHRRLMREYEGESWILGSRIDLPKDTELQDGAYILMGEANGQRAFAPLLVNPLGMSMIRSRDGVTVMVFEDAATPAAGAEIAASAPMLEPAKTNQDGVGFAKVFMRGDVALVAEHDGSYAIGGFGLPFYPIYDRQRSFDTMVQEARSEMLAPQEAMPALGQVYQDRLFAAVYTDRPTYRPGQQVSFKAIIRNLVHAPEESKVGRGFRDADFDIRHRFGLFEPGTEIHYQVYDSSGTQVDAGKGSLTEFGTFSGEFTLPETARVGAFTFRLSGVGSPRVVPDVFSVEYYRRPNFKVELGNLPKVLEPKQTVSLSLNAHYYFGKKVPDANVRLEVLETGEGFLREQVEGETDAAGSWSGDLDMPWEEGTYLLKAVVTDTSGRAVTVARYVRVEAARTALQRRQLDQIPVFCKRGQEVSFPAEEPVEVASDEELQLVHPQKGKVNITFDSTGWVTCTMGGAETRTYVYDAGTTPYAGEVELEVRKNPKGFDAFEWVDLSDEVYNSDNGLYGKVLFGKRHVNVGETLPVLLYLPGLEKGKVMLTMEGDSVVDYLMLEAHEGNPFYEVELPVRERLLPNFYLKVRRGNVKVQNLNQAVEESALKEEVVYGSGLFDPYWLRVEVEDPRRPEHGGDLKVSITADKASFKPGEEVRVGYQVTNLDGEPVDAELSLAAVDASLFVFGEGKEAQLPAQLGKQDPIRRFRLKSERLAFSEKDLGPVGMALKEELAQMLASAESLKSVAEAAMQESISLAAFDGRPHPQVRIDGEFPVTSLPLARLRQDFRETAFWAPHLRTDENGMGEASFRLPDSLTQYRLTAVGLTKDTRLGVGQTAIRASLPVSTQLILPRFAVEDDQIVIKAMVHNTTDTFIDATVSLTLDPLVDVVAAADWRLIGGKATRTISVPANGSAVANLRIRALQAGSATVRVDVQSSAGSDAETRELPIQVRGISTVFHRRGKLINSMGIDLPPALNVETASLSIRRQNRTFHPSEALDELDGLVAYPYGCVEQTMSRFLPAVVVSRALDKQALSLPAKVEEKLPAVLEQGLARLYRFQHKDGAWGWWENDETNLGMTVYVLHGLTLCQQAGVSVDGDVYRRGISFLKERLKTGRLTGRSFIHSSSLGDEYTLTACGWWVLARSGEADVQKLRAFLNAVEQFDSTPYTIAFAALAAKEAGLEKQATAFANRCAGWEPKETTGLAIKLRLQMAFRWDLKLALDTTVDLVAHRGARGWGSTRETAMAIESLALVMPYVPMKTEPVGEGEHINVRWGGQKLISTADAPFKPSVRLAGEEVPQGDRIQYDIGSRVSGDYQLTLKGQLRGDVEATGDEVQVTRRFTTANGEELGDIQVGDVIRVELTLKLTNAFGYFMIEDRRPSLCEFGDELLFGPLAEKAAHVEFRDDRVCMFFGDLPVGTHKVVYYLRAETPGTSNVLACQAYPMYKEHYRGNSSSSTLVVQ